MTAPAGPAAESPPVELATLGVDEAVAARCDPITAGACLLPFPNDHFTVEDASTPTGRRVAIDRESMPANVGGVHIDPAALESLDGFSPGAAAIVALGPLDPVASRLPSVTDMSASMREDSPIVLVDATTGERLPYWAELDQQADPGTDPLLLIHPARHHPEGHSIVVGIRNLVRPDGTPVEATPAFAAYRDDQRTSDEGFEARRPAMRSAFDVLARAGVSRAELQLAWSFTVASEEALSGRLLAMRDDAFGHLGDDAPAFTVDQVLDDPEPRVARQVDGTFETPLYLSGTGEPGARMVLSRNGTPVRSREVFRSRFRCLLPPSSRQEPGRPALYGHGLLGSVDELDSDMVRDMSDRYGVAYCATDFAGMSGADLSLVAAALTDMSAFGAIPDRLQQGLLANMFLGRLMLAEDGFRSDPAFRFGAARALGGDDLAYDGNSQGAILGGALVAVSPDITRAVLGEAGMNYSFLLDRSVDFTEYLTFLFAPAYPARVDRVLAVATAQMLWDRGETSGYAQHVVGDQYDGTRPHAVLLLGAIGDHQVSELALRIQARTMGVPAVLPLAAEGRTPERDPSFGLVQATEPDGSLFVLVDTGADPSPLGNRPAYTGRDPHDDTPNVPQIQRLKSAFLDGEVPLGHVCRPAAPCRFAIPENRR